MTVIPMVTRRLLRTKQAAAYLSMSEWKLRRLIQTEIIPFVQLDFMYPRGTSAQRYWSLIPDNLDVLITHGPPFGILDEIAPDEVHPPRLIAMEERFLSLAQMAL